MENNVVCKAEIKAKALVLIIISAVLIIVAALIFKVEKIEYKEEKETTYRFIDHLVIKHEPYNEGNVHYEVFVGLIIDYAVPAIILILLPLIVAGHSKLVSKQCSLELNDSGVEGKRKKLLSAAELKLPIEKVDSIMVKKNLFNALTGGKTIVISSASGRIKFPWVRNADEFAQAVRQKTDEVQNNK